MQVLAGLGLGSIWKESVLARHVDCDTDLFVDLVHGGKVVHVFQVHVNLDDLLPGRAGSGQDIAEVRYALSLHRRISR